MTPALTPEDMNVWIGSQIPPRLELACDAGSEAAGQDRAEVRAVLREALEEVRAHMERDGRCLYEGRWRTRDEIRTLRWQARREDFAWLTDIALVLLVSSGLVAFAYRLLLLLFP